MRVCLAIVLLALTAGPGRAGGALTDGSPADVGMSADVLREAVALYEKAVADDEVRGAVLLVARRGQVVLHQALGWRDPERRVAMQKDSLLHVASNTKPVLAAALLLLVEEGKID